MSVMQGIQLIVDMIILAIFVGAVFFVIYLIFVDRKQDQHSILRNYPVLGRVRYFFEKIGPEMRQYLMQSDNEATPFSRKDYLDVVKAGKYKSRIGGFGSRRDFTEPGFYLQNSLFPNEASELEIDQTKKLNTKIYKLDNEGLFSREEHREDAHVDPYLLTDNHAIVLGKNAAHPFKIKRLIGQSGMSYGALGKNAITALSKGLGLAEGTWMNTGEGGLSDHHLKGNVDIIFQIGPGLFGVRDEDGNFSEEKFIEKSQVEHVKAFELKLAQGAKTRGGHVEAEKVTEEIAKIRNVKPFTTINSPNRFTFIHNNIDLLNFIARLQKLSGKPVGFKMVVGNITMLEALVKDMKDTGIYPDFITVDGGEGGTGATYQELEDTVGLPLFSALPILDGVLKKNGLRDDIKIIASGKLITPDKVAIALGLGADLVQIARAMMMSVGCIMAQQCHTNDCPVGVATTDPDKEKGLVVEEKQYRVTNYVVSMHEGLFNLAAACGVKSPTEINVKHLLYRNENGEIMTGEQYVKKLYKGLEEAI
ncbi:FMN-binding glutamate synthase family protein [Macrococcus armenti]|uniref:FMN-binding glutamate synthase family protein n=1 Tax=Macrococcus armenti TaxID=2875764 RepID=UPI001CCD76E2|nr:FMN-binding glutamate synthase family protein [Macrococcus armenti]UBH08184.1 FMN-binding glutamate synthase family protein [Macrococcus armenti]UBH14945.1 FMN-binding glutamate synthase family protein [Macrococcus armenti]UBH17305.1 FMN-binding glutamate synthase family protein [Macrococcus armenti]UBH19570.1 FMN-binding glutamate synthase family protein [Macrococcus armenti]